MLKINHAFSLVQDCMEQLGQSKCDYMYEYNRSKSCTPYYGSPTYHYLQMGIGMSVSPQIWQEFVDLVFQEDII